MDGWWGYGWMVGWRGEDWLVAHTHFDIPFLMLLGVCLCVHTYLNLWPGWRIYGVGRGRG